MSSAATDMDAMYRLQRHIYDATRKFYLLGRDRMIRGLAVPAGGSVLEIGCGTARNLVAIARRYPTATCYGLDVSSVMLETARSSIWRAGLARRIIVAHGDATCFDPQALLGRGTFDRVVISYSLSMIPAWDDVLQAAERLAGGAGEVHIVDFGDQAQLPGWFRSLLHAWLRRFSVTPRIELPAVVERLAAETGRCADVGSWLGGYSTFAVLRPGSADPKGAAAACAGAQT